MRQSGIFIFFSLALIGCTEQMTFDDRVAQAKAYEDSAVLKLYFENYWRKIESHANAALEHCFPLDKVHYNRATLVADLLPNRTLSNIQVKPNDQMTRCFAKDFSGSPFPALPPSFSGEALPIRAEIALHGSRRAP